MALPTILNQHLSARVAHHSEPWNVVGASGQPAFGTGWSAAAGWAPPAFRLTPNGNVRIGGGFQFTGTGNNAKNTAAFTLPVGYRPSVTRVLSVLAWTSSATPNYLASYCLVASTGAVVLYGGTDTVSTSNPIVWVEAEFTLD